MQEPDPLRRRVDRAVVGEVPLPGCGRVRVVRVAELMQDAAWLFFTAWIDRDALQACELDQRRPRHRRKIVHQVGGHANGVTTEQAVVKAFRPGRGEQRTTAAERA